MRIWLLGGFRISVGASRSIEENSWRLKKAGNLIKLLALARGHRLHREQAMDLLWPKLDPEAAANNLHHALYVARRTLEPSAPAGAASAYLHLGGESLALSPAGPVWVDVEAFEEAATTARHTREAAAYWAAIDLYSGELLPQNRYEGWAEERRAQLRALYLSLLLEVAGLYEERREFGEAIEALGRVVAEDPTHEEAHVGLIRMYALLGRRREALRQFERLRDALSEDFGTEPEAATVRLHGEIWAGTFPPAAITPSGYLPAAGAGGRHNLPLARTSFIGREAERLEVKRLLAMTRLLTLTGVGGSGKTRLALGVAQDLAGAYPDGAWLVELAALSDPALVPQAVANALGVREQPGRPLAETLEDNLRARKMLLVIDNCEHLIEAVVHLVDALLDSCPHLRVLATSRETLGAAGEVVWVVPSLTVPEASTAEKLEGYESVRLFVDRARQRDPSFVLTPRNGPAVARVCRRLDGIPLAIELAAARMGVLSVEQVAERLEDPLKLLSGGGRTAEARQQTLRATLGWSHDLLGEAERAFSCRLSVFAGGWTLEAAEEVCSGESVEQEDALDLLSRLVDKSLVVAEAEREGAMRYRMLEPVRQYARERLEESGTLERVRERHARYYLKLAEEPGGEEADPRMKGSPPVVWLKRMETEHANLRAAFSWSLDLDAEEADGGREELGLRLAVALWWFWHTLGSLTEGRRYLEDSVSNSSSPTSARLRARALNGAAGIVIAQGDYGAAIAFAREGLALYRELGDEEGIASALTDLGLIALWGRRDDIPVSAIMEELEELEPRLENRRTLAWLLVLEGMIALSRGDLEHSVELHEESLELFRELGDTGAVINTLGQLGAILLFAGDHERVLPLLREDLRLGWESDYAVPIQFSLYFLACAAAFREQPVRAVRLWGAVEGMEEAYRVHISPIALSQSDYEGRLAAARSQLDEEVWSRAWEEGKAMLLERAVEYGLSEEEELSTLGPASEPADEPTQQLTRREREVALLVARGLTNRQIASELSISVNTANNHVAKILRKLGLGSRAEIAAWVAQRRSPSLKPD